MRSLPLMQGVRDEARRLARNIWTSKWFFDIKKQEYILLWSSSFEDAGWKKSRLRYARTRDWQTFTPAQVLLSPGYSAIDGTLLEHSGIQVIPTCAAAPTGFPYVDGEPAGKRGVHFRIQLPG